jgi:hypothetical protein
MPIQNHQNLAQKLIEINGVESIFATKETYTLLDLIEYSDPSGNGYVYCLFEAPDGEYALQVYSSTNEKGFLPILSNQQVDNSGYNYIVGGVNKPLKDNDFDLLGEFEQKDILGIILIAKVNEKSEEFLWYPAQDFLTIIESQLANFDDLDFELIKQFIVKRNPLILN